MLRMHLFHLQECKTVNFVSESLSQSQYGWGWQGLQGLSDPTRGTQRTQSRTPSTTSRWLLRDLQGDSTASLGNFARAEALRSTFEDSQIKVNCTNNCSVYSKSEYLKAMQHGMHCFQCCELDGLLYHSGLCSKLYNWILFALPFSPLLHAKPAWSLVVGKNIQTNPLIKLKRHVTYGHIFYP